MVKAFDTAVADMPCSAGPKVADPPLEETGFEISVPRCARTADSVTVDTA